MKRLVTIIATAILIVGLALSGLNDIRIAIADTGIPDNELTTSQTQASNSSAGATITITMTGILDE